MIINLCLIIVIVLISLILISYNSLIRKKNQVKNASSGIDVVLKRRFDLIPNLVECVKGYSTYESDTLEDLVNARNIYNNKNGLDIETAERINSKINRVLAIAENYPDLKSDTQYMNLQNVLREIENDLQKARNRYNSSVTSYNTSIESVPTNLIAKLFAFEKLELFKIENEQKINIDINV